jgi:hypothetical protein
MPAAVNSASGRASWAARPKRGIAGDRRDLRLCHGHVSRQPEMPEAVHDRPIAIVGGVYVGGVEEGVRAMQP